MTPSISVVIPFYKAEGFFNDVYSSLKAQTLQPDEIIVVIDGYSRIAEDFLKNFDDLTVIPLNENGGPARARNIGVSHAKSEFIAFIDADDKWATDKLEKQSEFLAEHSEFSACHTGIKTFNDNKIISTFNNKSFDLTLREVLTTCHVLPSALMIKKSAFEAINGFDPKIKCSEDQDFSISLISQQYKIGFLALPLAFLRREEHGNISSNGRNILIGHFQILNKHWSLYKQYQGVRSLFIYSTFMSCGGKSTGIEKKCYYFCGKLVSVIFPKTLSQQV